MSSTTVAEVFGPDAANELAMIAIDLLAHPPIRIGTATTRVPTSMVERGRKIMDDAGIPWRASKQSSRSTTRDLKERHS